MWLELQVGAGVGSGEAGTNDAEREKKLLPLGRAQRSSRSSWNTGKATGARLGDRFGHFFCLFFLFFWVCSTHCRLAEMLLLFLIGLAGALGQLQAFETANAAFATVGCFCLLWKMCSRSSCFAGRASDDCMQHALVSRQTGSPAAKGLRNGRESRKGGCKEEPRCHASVPPQRLLALGRDCGAPVLHALCWCETRALDDDSR